MQRMTLVIVAIALVSAAVLGLVVGRLAGGGATAPVQATATLMVTSVPTFLLTPASSPVPATPVAFIDTTDASPQSVSASPKAAPPQATAAPAHTPVPAGE